MTTIIKARLADLLNILDARQTINIYTDETTCVFSGYVYEFLTTADYYKQYKNYIVIGLVVDLVNNILIQKGV